MEPPQEGEATGSTTRRTMMRSNEQEEETDHRGDNVSGGGASMQIRFWEPSLPHGSSYRFVSWVPEATQLPPDTSSWGHVEGGAAPPPPQLVIPTNHLLNICPGAAPCK